MPIIVESDLPAGCKSDVDVVFGIDEAGRGPVLGPMVYGCAYWPIAEEEQIKSYGFDDSKALTFEKRSSLFKRMNTCGLIGWMTHSLTAQEIGAAMLHRAHARISLNVLSHQAAASMLEATLARGVRVTRVYVDTVGDARYYQSNLERHFNYGRGGGGGTAGRGWAIDFTVCPKADSLYKCVSAASIAAKVERDRSIREWKFDEPAFANVTAESVLAARAGEEEEHEISEEEEEEEEDDIVVTQTNKKPRLAEQEVKDKGAKGPSASTARPVSIHPLTSGSGYPSDPHTKAWMVQHIDKVFGWPSVCRMSWAPARDALEKDGVAVDWGLEEGEEAGPPQSKIGSFFSSTSAASATWMKKRNLVPVLDL